MYLHRWFIMTAAAIAWLAADPVRAQVERLPMVMPPAEPYAVRLASHPETRIEPLPPVDTLFLPADTGEPNYWNRPPDARNGFFQELFLDATWLADGRGDAALGDTQLEIRARFAMPLPSRRHPLLITPGFAVHFLDGPVSPDLPARVYDTYVQFRWLHWLSERWSIDLSVTPGVFSDFQQGTDEALRITGHFGTMWTLTPALKILLGVAYLDREDLRIMPFAGLIWEPRDDVKFELVVPRPKISKRVYWSGACTDEVQDWVYLAGELGGGSWAVRRADDTNDVVTYRDLRLILGLERKAMDALDYRLELAYIFARKTEFESDTPKTKPADTVMLRVGVTY